MTDDAHGYQNSRTTRTRWSVFEPMGHEGADGDAPDGDVSNSDIEESGTADVPLEPLLVAVAGELRRPVMLSPQLDARVMALVAGEPRPQREVAVAKGASGGMGQTARERTSVAVVARAWRWLRRPRLILISPLGGLTAVVGLAALLVLTARPGIQKGGRAAPTLSEPALATSSTIAATAVDSIQVIQFVLVAPGAQRVALVGDFNDWQAGATPMSVAAAGRVWSVQVPLSAGRHRYAFVVDEDRWVPDPSAPRASGDDFGTPSSVVTVSERRS